MPRPLDFITGQLFYDMYRNQTFCIVRVGGLKVLFVYTIVWTVVEFTSGGIATVEYV